MQQERFVPSNNMLIPFQIINNQPKCNNWNNKLDMYNYGLTSEKQTNLNLNWNTVGLLANIDEKQSPFYNSIKIDENYTQFLKNTQMCKKL